MMFKYIKTFLLCAYIGVSLEGNGQTTSVKCSYLAAHRISDAVKNMEDVHIREMIIQKMQGDKKMYEMVYSDDVYSFSLAGGTGDSDIKSVGQASCYYLDFGSDSLFIQRQILDKAFLVVDTISHSSWTISDERKVVNSMECTKATTSAGSYDVTAWFSPEIAVPYGPLGYFGLPGLIIELETPTYTYTLQDISYPTEKLTFTKPTAGKVVTQKEFDQLEAESMKSRGNITPGGVKVIRIGQ
ncbi:MAG: hypothetical protein AUK64_2080 [bacterium P201]|nr:MAG: hypothetical protein AUK64_2080 [bacterium P201]